MPAAAGQGILLILLQESLRRELSSREHSGLQGGGRSEIKKETGSGLTAPHRPAVSGAHTLDTRKN